MSLKWFICYKICPVPKPFNFYGLKACSGNSMMLRKNLNWCYLRAT